MKQISKTEKATFGAGCFWHVQLAFDGLKGVVKTEVGYMGGKMDNPTYEDVCTDETGHVEVCQVEFDPSKITYAKLLDAFWKMHNPTQMNRQGPDVGTQYKSVIFYHSDSQKKTAMESKHNLEKSGKYSKPIETSIEKSAIFYLAEDYHQKYLKKRGMKTCSI